MSRIYFKEAGFGGLTSKSKLIIISVVILVAAISWFLLRSKLLLLGMSYILNDLPTKGSFFYNTFGVLEALLLGAIGGAILDQFLPRQTYYKDEYFCADCGQFIGYNSTTCERCGCNRNTKEDSGAGKTIRNK